MTFTRLGLIAKQHDPKLAITLEALYRHLGELGIQVLLHKSAAAQLPGTQGVSSQDIGQQCDAAIVIGGDGSLLGAARKLAEYALPLIGVNLGRLGFLVDVSPSQEFAELDAILAGNYRPERRLLLVAEVFRGQQQLFSNYAFNDAVLRIKEKVRMLEFETWIDGGFVNTQRADGMIIASPTGSTAYALSAGGPVLTPGLEALALLPVCSHTFSSRPIVISANSEVELRLCAENQEAAQLVCDGQINFTVTPGDRILVRRAQHDVHLLHPQSYNYFTMLRAKLKWG